MTSPTPLADARGSSGDRTRGGTDAEPVAYDFRRPIQLSREHQRVLHVALDAFARQATTIFTSALRTVCHVSVRSIDQRSYAEYVDGLPSMTHLTKFSIEPVPGVGVLEIPLNAVMSSIEHMLGGPGSSDQPERALTEIETMVLGGLLDRLLDGLGYALSELVAIEPVILGVEYNPQFAQVASAGDVMVLVELEVRINERLHRVTVLLPFDGLLPHLTAATAPAPVSARERAQRVQAAELLHRRFRDVPVDVAVQLRGTRMLPQAFAGLRTGDVLRLAHPASAPLNVTVNEIVFAHATAGSRGPHLAALIVATPRGALVSITVQPAGRTSEEAALAAATAAAGLLPSAEPLNAAGSQPGNDQLADLFAGAVVADLAGGLIGPVAVLVGADLMSALTEGPMGAGLDVGAALQPALDAAAATLGGSAQVARALPPEAALTAFTGSYTVVPLVGSTVAAALLVGDGTLAGPPAPMVATFEAAPGSAAPSVDAIPLASAAQPTSFVLPTRGLEILHGVDMEVTVELGRTRMLVRDLLSLTPGNVLELDRAAGSPADLLVNGRLIARGEVVVVGENFGLRVTEILDDNVAG